MPCFYLVVVIIHKKALLCPKVCTELSAVNQEMNIYDEKIRKKIDYLTRRHAVTAHESPLPAMDHSRPEPLSFLDY
jgi:hypothetical protein